VIFGRIGSSGDDDDDDDDDGGGGGGGVRRGSVVGVVSRLLIGRTGIRIAVGTRDYFLLQNVQASERSVT
jgi:hypothetical protein